jgi:hypothetical protein
MISGSLARLSRVNSPIQFYGDDIEPDVRLCQGPPARTRRVFSLLRRSPGAV